MLRRTAVLALAAVALLAVSAVPAAAAPSSGPEAVASKSCGLAGKTRKLGPTYTTALSVKRVGCRKGRKMVRAYYDCRIANGGKRASCGRRVSGFACSERRYDAIPTQFSARVTCKKGKKRVKHTYTQFT